jgi:hypothetical protein
MSKNTTWKEWIVLALLVPPLLFVAMIIVGTVIDTAAQNSERHDRCLKNATTGYEIKQCR